jgi:hypothetical protein
VKKKKKKTKVTGLEGVFSQHFVSRAANISTCSEAELKRLPAGAIRAQ